MPSKNFENRERVIWKQLNTSMVRPNLKYAIQVHGHQLFRGKF